MSRRQPLPRTPDSTRAEALALADQVGAAEAARRLGLNASTLRGWRAGSGAGTGSGSLASVRTASAVVARAVEESPAALDLDDAAMPESVRAALADRGKPLTQDRLDRLAVAFVDLAAVAVAVAEHNARHGRGRPAKDLATTAAISVDKALLASGRPTRVTESTSTSVHVEHRRVTVETDAGLRRQVEQLRAELGRPPLELDAGPDESDVVDGEVVGDGA